MPCYTVRLVEVEFKAKHKDVLIKSLVSLSWKFVERENKIILSDKSITIDLTEQKVIVPKYNQTYVNELKRQYSLETIKKATSTKFWTMKTVGVNEYQAVRY